MPTSAQGNREQKSLPDISRGLGLGVDRVKGGNEHGSMKWKAAVPCQRGPFSIRPGSLNLDGNGRPTNPPESEGALPGGRQAQASQSGNSDLRKCRVREDAKGRTKAPARAGHPNAGEGWREKVEGEDATDEEGPEDKGLQNARLQTGS